MNNSILEIIIKARDEASSTISGMTGKLKEMEPTFKKMAAVGTVAFGAVAAVAGDALKEFAEDQAQMALATKTVENALTNMTEAQRKTATGMSNLKDGIGVVTQKMTEAGKAALKLGFDDEEASRAFGKLFQVTGDTAEANKELQTAMDLARDKGIGLMDAVKVLTLVHAGATKELKAQGIEIDKDATAMENIGKISDTLSGKALAYAQTTKGQWDIMTQSINNTKSALGEALAPVLTQILTQLQPIIQKIMDWIQANPELTRNIVLATMAIAGIVAVVGTLGLILPAVITGFTLLAGPVGIIIAALGLLWFAIDKIIKIYVLLRDHSAEVWAGLKIMFKEAIDAIVAYFQPLIDIVNKVSDAIGKVASKMASVGQAVGGKISSAWNSVFGKAQGGSVVGGSTYLVGENGPELFTATSSGNITPNRNLAGGNGGIVVNINGGNYLSEDAALQMGDYIIKALQMQMRGAR